MPAINKSIDREKILIAAPLVLTLMFFIHELTTPGAKSHMFVSGGLILCSIFIAIYAINQKHAAKQELLKTRIASIAFDSDEAIVITDADTNILDVNAAFCRISGYERSEVIGKKANMMRSGEHDAEFYESMWQRIVESGSWAGEVIDRRKSGETYIKWLLVTAICDPNGVITNYVGKFYDLTHQRKIEEDIRRLSYSDALTGLPNRRKLHDLLINALSESKNTHSCGILMIVNMDNFRRANEIHGHAIGDLLLIEVASRIHSLVGHDYHTARMGGDEFAVLIPHAGMSEQEATGRAQIIGMRIVDSFVSPVICRGGEFHTSPTIGVAIFCGTGSVGEVLKQADSAMHAAKDAGKNRVGFFSDELSRQIARRFELENALRAAISGKQISIVFQPKVNHDRKLVGAEALMRWNRNGESISPVHFIKIAEETGIILRLGLWALHQTCIQIQQWEAKDILPDRFFTSVNISPLQLRQLGFVDSVINTIDEVGISPRRIKLEITESSIIENIDDAVAKLNALRIAGIETVMDDFGTGYSSLSYLQRLPISQIKIDKSFVTNIENDHDSEAIVKIIASLGSALKVSVLAEGVETEQQFRLLGIAGCSFFQGYYFGKPMPHGEFEMMLKNSLEQG